MNPSRGRGETTPTPPRRGGASSGVATRRYLYTTGYVPSLGRYPHGHVPTPVQITDHVGDSSAKALLAEVLLMTKMNWNSARFAEKLPVTVRFANEVGTILRDLPDAQAVAVGDSNGLPIASLARSTAANATPAMESTAMATMALAAAQQIVSGLRLGKAQEVLIRAGGALVIIQDLGRQFSLSVVLSSEANLGFATLIIQRFADDIRMMLASLV